MNLRTLSTAALALMSLAAFAKDTPAKSTTVYGGAVHFKGEVVNAACGVDADSMDQTIQMGQAKTADLTKDGETSRDGRDFTIALNGCDTTVAKSAAVAFNGHATSGKPTVLSLSGSAAGYASNVGIEILDRTGAALKVDGSTYTQAQELIDGQNLLLFTARYIATGPAKPGIANADTTFLVQYQ